MTPTVPKPTKTMTFFHVTKNYFQVSSFILPMLFMFDICFTFTVKWKQATSCWVGAETKTRTFNFKTKLEKNEDLKVKQISFTLIIYKNIFLINILFDLNITSLYFLTINGKTCLKKNKTSHSVTYLVLDTLKENKELNRDCTEKRCKTLKYEVYLNNQWNSFLMMSYRRITV